MGRGGRGSGRGRGGAKDKLRLAPVALVTLPASLSLPAANDVLVDVPNAEVGKLPRYVVPEGTRTILATTLGEASDAVDAVSAAMAAAEVCFLGFDTETRPCFTSGVTHPLDVIQLYAPGVAAVFHCRSGGALELAKASPLLSLLGDGSVLKAAAGVAGDVRALRTRLDESVPLNGMLCLTPIVQKRYPKIKKIGLRGTAAAVLGRGLSKGQQMANWAREMTPAMLAYAAADAAASYEILAAALEPDARAKVRVSPFVAAAQDPKRQKVEA